MSDATNQTIAKDTSISPRLYGIALLVTILVLSGIWLISRYTHIDFDNDKKIWRDKITLIADSRSKEVNAWVAEHFNNLNVLATNPSLQIYMTELQLKTHPTKAPTLKGYLRNLLLFSAERSGYISKNSTSNIKANIPSKHTAGLAIINQNKELVVSTMISDETRNVMLAEIEKTKPGEERFIDMYKAKDGGLHVGFIVPIYPIHTDKTPEHQLGYVVGITATDEAFFDLLKHPGTTEKSLRTILMRLEKKNKKGEYTKAMFLSPLRGGKQGLEKSLTLDKRRFTEIHLIENPGMFMNTARDYRDRPTLATSRKIERTPWVMISRIDRPEAYREGNQRRLSMITFFLLLIAFITIMVIAIWWYAHSKHSSFLARRMQKVMKEVQAQKALLQLVTDYQPDGLMIVDKQNTIHFANLQIAMDANTELSAIINKSVKEALGKDRAVQIGGHCMQALEDHKICYDIQRMQTDVGERITRSAFIPLDTIPLATLDKKTPGVLIVEQDVSDVVLERERLVKTSNQVVNMLVKLVDNRDPYSANHSQLVSKVSYEIAVSMGIEPVMVETTQIAATLMNVGKIIIPMTLLTKTGDLSDEEMETIHAAMHSAADMLHDISFNGPVEDTLRQWQERWDGTGPLAMKGEDILISARIIAVSNAFVGMISPRAWREALSIDDANKHLMEDSDTAFDRRIVAALINYVDNHNGREWLNQTLVDASKIKSGLFNERS